MATTTRRVGRNGFRTFIVLASVWLSFTGGTAAAQTPLESGYRDFAYGTTPTANPSGERPQSKLWWNDGVWWGSLFSPAAGRYHIYRLDPGTNGWIDTGVQIDDRPTTKADTLWEPATGKLYVVSNYFSSAAAASSSPSRWGRLYRYSYTSPGQYVLDPGFPITVTKGSAEALTIARDTAGRLWVTWVENKSVKINYSLSNDLDWSAPVNLPVGSAGVVTADDISAVIAFGGGRVGVMWSNQNVNKTYFVVRRDVDAPTVWQPIEAVMPACTGLCSDDHINLKTDASGQVYAAIKTSFTQDSSPLIVLAVRNTLGAWANHTVGIDANHHTRPIVLLAEENNQLFVFATAPEAGGAIYFKTSPLSSISFPPGLGTLFLISSSDPAINNITSTKSSVTQASGIVGLATDVDTRRYLHNFLSLGGASISSFTPSTGGAGTSVIIGGNGLSGATEVRFNQTLATFTVVSDQRIDAIVPFGATTGPVSVTTPTGTVTTSATFAVPTAPAIQSFSPATGAPGTSVVITGAGFSGATDVTFNGTSAAFTVQSDTSIATAVPSGASTGPIAVTNAAGTATSAANFTVSGSGLTTLRVATFENGGLTAAGGGVDRVNGTVTLETASPLVGAYSARIVNRSDSYLEETFPDVGDLFASVYIRVDALPTSDVRIMQISNAGTTVGSLTLRTNGTLRLKVGSTVVGLDSAPLSVGQVYRIALRQRVGSGSNGLLEGLLAVGEEEYSAPFASLTTGTWTTLASRVRVGATVLAPAWITLDNLILLALPMGAPPPEPSLSR